MVTPSDPDDAARRKGTAELLVLAQLEARARHGYEIGREIERRSDGRVVFQIASLYPVLYRLESDGLIAGLWVETPGKRRRRFYHLTPSGCKRLAQQRQSWGEFFEALRCAGGIKIA
jgi:DNA-binding PadR family transcriptional regulator